MKDTYNVYLRYKAIIELLAKKEYTSLQIAKKTKIPQATAFRMIGSLLKNNIVMISKKTPSKKKIGRHTQVFKLKRSNI